MQLGGEARQNNPRGATPAEGLGERPSWFLMGAIGRYRGDHPESHIAK
jgi:hypothetical protein